jgi:phage/plasmid-associated DNA primase
MMKMNLGPTAANGKSTELKIHDAAFPIYTTKLDRRTVDVKFEKRHKQYLELIRKPRRLVYIEELDRVSIDADELKDFVDGNKLSVEILYGTKEVGKIQCKLVTTSNKDPNISSDEGVRRRIKCQIYSSRFLPGVVDDTTTHTYRREESFEQKVVGSAHHKNA